MANGSSFPPTNTNNPNTITPASNNPDPDNVSGTNKSAKKKLVLTVKDKRELRDLNYVTDNDELNTTQPLLTRTVNTQSIQSQPPLQQTSSSSNMLVSNIASPATTAATNQLHTNDGAEVHMPTMLEALVISTQQTLVENEIIKHKKRTTSLAIFKTLDAEFARLPLYKKKYSNILCNGKLLLTINMALIRIIYHEKYPLFIRQLAESLTDFCLFDQPFGNWSLNKEGLRQRIQQANIDELRILKNNLKVFCHQGVKLYRLMESAKLEILENK